MTKPWPGRLCDFAVGRSRHVPMSSGARFMTSCGRHGITGFATIAGDRHSFWAGLAAKTLPPKAFEPVGIAFVTGSISAPGVVEALEHMFPKDHPLRSLYVGQGPEDHGPQPTVQLLMRHGVRSCLEYARSGDIAKARALSNPDLAPHPLVCGYGRAWLFGGAGDERVLETEFVCIPRPLERSERLDGGDLRYRVKFRTGVWKSGEAPKIEMRWIEGDPKFSV